MELLSRGSRRGETAAVNSACIMEFFQRLRLLESAIPANIFLVKLFILYVLDGFLNIFIITFLKFGSEWGIRTLDPYY